MFFNYFHPADTFGMSPGPQLETHSTNLAAPVAPIPPPAGGAQRAVVQVPVGNPGGRHLNGLQGLGVNPAPAGTLSHYSRNDTTALVTPGRDVDMNDRETRIVIVTRKTHLRKITKRTTSRVRDPVTGRRERRTRVKTKVRITQTEEIRDRTIQS